MTLKSVALHMYIHVVEIKVLEEILFRNNVLGNFPCCIKNKIHLQYTELLDYWVIICSSESNNGEGVRDKDTTLVVRQVIPRLAATII